MATKPGSHSQPFVRRLESIFALSEEEKRAIVDLPMQVVELKADQDIVREGDRPSRCCLLLDGVVCTYKLTGDGKRQIMAFHLAGDVPDLQSLHLRVLDSSLATLTPCKVGFIRHEAMRELYERFPRIGDAFWRTTLVDGSIFREWLANVGQRNSHARIAHLLCETLVRSKAVGLATEETCDFPITQQEIAEATGMTVVHANRVIQDLRASGLIELRQNKLTVPDLDRLMEAGDFDPAYLHLNEPQRVAA
ncbi:Crp/Fnr family transcriptional regulator [uncultured Enterovirga sp.]|uniref:Crp/Fnr family transcriptional regulator n=1 Tax=uncultured Enterovirga sp. TaxID=2026352 RepID=UPI0035C9AAE1